MGSKFLRTPKLKISMPMQKAYLDSKYPNSKCIVQRGELTWTGYVQPTPYSFKYRLKITWTENRSPKVYVIEPMLNKYNDQNIPHLYSQEEQRLCLFHPSYYEWNNGMYIADSIIPWASEWFIYYELWLATGEWLGGGEHIEEKKE